MGFMEGEQVPEWEFRPGNIRQVKKTKYFTDAQGDVNQYAQKGILGYWVRNSFGCVLPMTFIQYHRMISLFEEDQLDIVDYYRNHQVDAHIKGLDGFDTEGAEAVFG